MQALFVAWYNFARKHEALKGNTPAMASKLTDHVWTIKELIERAAAAMRFHKLRIALLCRLHAHLLPAAADRVEGEELRNRGRY